MKDLVSVIVPVYNVEKYLDECIQSILCQTYQNIEIILIDDGSSDSSNLICQKYKKKDSRIKVITKGNEGQAVARNIGIKEANGEYIYFLDSDDYIKPETIEKVLDYMKKNNADLCYFSGELLLEAKNLLWDKNMYKRTKSYAVSNGIAVMNQLVKNNEYTCQNCMLMTKLSLIQDNNIQYTEGYIYEDNYFAFLLGMYSKTSCVLNEDFYVRRIREGSVMTKESVLNKRIKAYKRVLADFNSIKTDDKMLSGLLTVFKRGFIISIIKYAEQLNNKEISKEVYRYLYKDFCFKDIKLYFYLKFRNMCHFFRVKDPINLIK